MNSSHKKSALKENDGIEQPESISATAVAQIQNFRRAQPSAEELIAKYEKQSTNVKNSREFEAINKEIEMQQLEVKLAEKHIKDANEEISEKVVGLDKAKKALSSILQMTVLTLES